MGPAAGQDFAFQALELAVRSKNPGLTGDVMQPMAWTVTHPHLMQTCRDVK
jgi:hypothetical protein